MKKRFSSGAMLMFINYQEKKSGKHKLFIWDIKENQHNAFSLT